MQWVDTHLNKHHFFHAPHKWFWAVILSPVHAAEMHYKKRYHLTYIHAKKLFFFDMALLASIGMLMAGSYVWFTYDPTVLDAITLRIDTTSDRIQAGEHVAYTITYQNDSEKILRNTALAVRLPAGFIIQSTSPTEGFQGETNSFALPDLTAHASGSVTIQGWFYGTPHEDDRISATLSYQPEDRSVREQKHVSLLATLRGSQLNASLILPDTMISDGSAPFTLTVTQDGNAPLKELSIPLSFGEGITLDDLSPSIGTVVNNVWTIHLQGADTFTSGTLHGQLAIHAPGHEHKKQISLTPIIRIAGKTFPQQEVARSVTLIHPRAEADIVWHEERESIRPGDSVSGTIRIRNTGSVPLSRLTVRIPLSPPIDAERFKKEHHAVIEKNALVLTAAKHANLLALPPNASTELTVSIPVKKTIDSGEHLELRVAPLITADITSVPDSSFTISTESKKIKISSSLLLRAELRYFTEEGDQLGRGPLPPEVGKETKYWAFIHLFNRTNEVRDVAITATLPPGVTWTGKSSVSHGNEARYHASSKTITWTTQELEPHSQAGVYLELGIIPTNEQMNTSPLILTNISATATDGFTNIALHTTVPPLDTSLPTDEEGRKEGNKVQ